MPCKYLIVRPRKHVCGTVRTLFRRLCQKAHHGRLHQTVSAGFSGGGIALRGMRCCVEAAEAFIPLHGERRFAVLTFSRHLGCVKLCPSITNSSRLPLSLASLASSLISNTPQNSWHQRSNPLFLPSLRLSLEIIMLSSFTEGEA